MVLSLIRNVAGKSIEGTLDAVVTFDNSEDRWKILYPPYCCYNFNIPVEESQLQEHEHVVEGKQFGFIEK